MERLVQQGYLESLAEAYRTHPEAFRPTPGAPALLQFLRARKTEGLDMAIATGDWHPTIAFKLQACLPLRARFGLSENKSGTRTNSSLPERGGRLFPVGTRSTASHFFWPLLAPQRIACPSGRQSR